MENQNIGKNLVRIRKEKGISQKELASIVNMAPQTLLKIEKGITNPKTETIDKIVKALGVTPNDLYGDSDFQKMVIQLPFARNLQSAISDAGMSEYDLAEQLGVDISIVTEMEKGTLVPSDSRLKELCNILQVTESDLMGNDMHTVNRKEVELMALIKEKNNVLEYINNIQSSNDNIESTYEDPVTGELIVNVLTSDDQAKGKLLSIFKELSTEQLKDIYDQWMSRQIMEQIKGM